MKTFNQIGLQSLVFILIFMSSCRDSLKSSNNKNITVDDTAKMTAELKALVDNGDPKVYYHWNSRRLADLRQLQPTAGNNRNKVWFQMVLETLNAGKNQLVINEVNAFAQQFGGMSAPNLTESSKPIFDVLAMANLRLGEQQNCQENHTPQSCILPLQAKAVHRLKAGSTKAIELYEILLSKYPEEWKYKWLLNLAYMTLGEHPEGVPDEFLIPFPSSRESQEFTRFNDIAEYVGVAENGLSGGVCTEDFNNDGYLDILVTSYGMSDQVKLFINDKAGRFQDKTKESGLSGIVSGLNTIHADYDNDGDRDVLILRGAWLTIGGKHPNSLLRNNGNGTFSDVTFSSGILSYHPTQTASWADYNEDGLLDLFIGNESAQGDSHPSELYQNNGNGTFTNVINSIGIPADLGYVKGVTWGDINNDGKPDLYVSIMGKANKLFQNIGGKFIDVTAKADVAGPTHSFPTWFFDYNNDGFEDLFVCSYDNRRLTEVAGDYGSEMATGNHQGEKSKLYRNNGNGTFSDVTEAMGLSGSMYGMGCNFGDLDNDGFLDFYIGTGAPDLSSQVPNRMFRNINGERFEEVTSSGGFGHIQKGHGASFSDLDNDGDQDIYMVLGGAFEGDFFSNVLFENPGFSNNWISIDVEGVTNNKDGIGARIKVTTDTGKFYRSVNTGGSFGSASLRQEIGLGDATEIQSIDIRWPDGQRQKFDHVPINQIIKIKEGGSTTTAVDAKPIEFERQ